MAAAAYALEPSWVRGAVTGGVLVSLFYQSVIVAFASYLTWFKLIHAYPVGGVCRFCLLSRVFGVAWG